MPRIFHWLATDGGVATKCFMIQTRYTSHVTPVSSCNYMYNITANIIFTIDASSVGIIHLQVRSAAIESRVKELIVVNPVSRFDIAGSIRAVNVRRAVGPWARAVNVGGAVRPWIRRRLVRGGMVNSSRSSSRCKRLGGGFVGRGVSNGLRGEVPEVGLLLHAAHAAEDCLWVDGAGHHHALRKLVAQDAAHALRVF